MHTNIILHTYIHTYIHTNIHPYIHKYIHTYIQYIHTYIHTYIHIYIRTIVLLLHTYSKDLCFVFLHISTSLLTTLVLPVSRHYGRLIERHTHRETDGKRVRHGGKQADMQARNGEDKDYRQWSSASAWMPARLA